MTGAPATWDLLIRRARLATMAAGSPYGEVLGGALAVRDGRIAFIGLDASLPAGATAALELDAEGRLLTPGLVDCHTHLVHAGHRAAEFEQRLLGASYGEIARAGGGIRSTVAATRAADAATLLRESRPRLAALMADGVTTVEVKSGYGLDLDTELKQLTVARRLGELLPVTIRTSFLGAHAVPPEFEGRADAYLDFVIGEVLPAVAAAGLADAVDAYCEEIAFSPAQVERLFAAAARIPLPVKLHADQLADSGGAALAARHRALSADHLEHLSADGVLALAGAGTVAVLLPGAWLHLRDTRPPPVTALRAAGVSMAVATDCNPGTSPLASLTTAMNLACTLFRLTPAEALAGATRHAARALGLDDRGVLSPGRRADLALWNAGHPAELAARLGPSSLATRFVAGRPDHAQAR
jgi:imidazolonepropionase